MPESGTHSGNREQQEQLRRKTRRVLLILALVALILAGWGIASRLLARNRLRKQTGNEATPTVVVARPTLSGAGDELVLPGTVQAFVEAPLYARTSGYLRAWYADIGAHVHKGQVLALIDTPEVDRELGQARADLATARANADLARTTNERWQGLAAKQAVSKQDADEKAGDAAAKAAAQAAAAQNVARLSDLESFRRVVAPFDGVVTARNTDIGALINAGQAAGSELFRIADIHKLRVYAEVPESYALAARSGLKAELRFVEHPGKPYPAATIRTSNALDPTARTLQVELQLDNRNGELFPGAYAEIHFRLPSAGQTLRVPSNTILFRNEGLQVATVDANHHIRVKNIIQGRDFGTTVEVLEGLDSQDAVVVNPSDSIEDGMMVRIAPPPQDGGGKAHSKTNVAAL